MELEEIVKELPKNQKDYLTAVALRTPEPLKVTDTPNISIEGWTRTSEAFRTALQFILEGDYVAQAIKLWFSQDTLAYLMKIKDLALNANSERVQLDALKYVNMLIGGERKKVTELTSMEEYLLGEKKTTLTQKVTDG